MKTSGILSIVALALAALVGFAEIVYYLSHPYRHGVSPHLIGLSVAVVIVAVAQILGRKGELGNITLIDRLLILILGVGFIIALWHIGDGLNHIGHTSGGLEPRGLGSLRL